jgi:hypothetical protein
MPVSKTSTNNEINLTRASALMRNIIKFGGVALIAIMVGRVFWGALVSYWKATHPPPPAPPTVGFGKLPHLTFPVSSAKPTTYTLQTISGKTPDIADRAFVYFIPSSDPSLLALDRAKKKASSLGYLFEPEQLTSRKYRWTLNTPIYSTLDMDILSGTLSINTDWASHPELLTKVATINSDSLVDRLKAILSGADSLPDDFKQGPSKTKFLKSLGGKFTEASSLSDAEFLQIDLYRTPVSEKYLGVTDQANQGPIHAVIDSQGTILELRMEAYQVNSQIVHDYPLRTSAEAWQILASGEGYVVAKGTSDQAVVRAITLGYYEPSSEQSFYQPVYVFEGDGGFVGYVEAISPEWLVTSDK